MAIRTMVMVAALAGLAVPGVAAAQGYPGGYAYGYRGAAGPYGEGYVSPDRHEEKLIERQRRYEAKERYRAWKRAHRHGYDGYRDGYRY